MYDNRERLALDADGTEEGERAVGSRICTDEVCASLRHFTLVRDSAHVTRNVIGVVSGCLRCVYSYVRASVCLLVQFDTAPEALQAP